MTAIDPGDSAVILIGIDTPIGLTVIRELGSRGVKVIGVGRSPQAIGRYSRHLAEFVERPPIAVDVSQWLPELAQRTGARIVMAVSESDLLMLDARRSRLPGLRLLLPPSEALQIVLDKRRTLSVARSQGIPVPVEYDPSDLLRSDEAMNRVNFPVVLKWGDPNEISGRLHEAGLPLLKAEYCLTAIELRAALKRYTSLQLFPLVQEYVRGHGLGQMLLMVQGKAVQRFQHRRLHEWPPEGGVSTWCEAVNDGEHASLMSQSIALLQALGWEGPAMVEYRYDEASGKAVLMEINGRFWGSLPLASLAGVPFAWGTYRALGLQQEVEVGVVKSGIRARFMIPETRRLLRVLFRPSAIADPSYVNRPWRDLFDYLRCFIDSREHYFVFRTDDPMPFFADLWHAMTRSFFTTGAR